MIRETYESMSDPRMLVSDDSGTFLITIGSTPDDELTLKSALWWCEGQTGNACGIVSINGVDVKNPKFKKRRTAK